MFEIISDAFWDSPNVVPLLLAIYIVIGLAEYKFGDVIITKVKKAGRAGPLIGALAGIFPQCGFFGDRDCTLYSEAGYHRNFAGGLSCDFR
jgi:hypothetical protein